MSAPSEIEKDGVATIYCFNPMWEKTVEHFRILCEWESNAKWLLVRWDGEGHCALVQRGRDRIPEYEFISTVIAVVGYELRDQLEANALMRKALEEVVDRPAREALRHDYDSFHEIPGHVMTMCREALAKAGGK